MRLRAVARAVDVSLGGLDAFACRTIATGAPLGIGGAEGGGVAVRQGGMAEGRGAPFSYRVVQGADGVCRLQHTSEGGAVAIDGRVVASSEMPAEGITWREGARASFALGGRTLLELVLEADEPRELVVEPCAITLVSFDEDDGTGRAVADDGEELSCGATSFARRRRDPSWRPYAGARYYLTSAKLVPRVGLRAVDVHESVEDAAMAAVPVLEERLPRTSLADTLAWLDARGRPPARASRGASEDEVRALEARFGMALPASYVAFLRRYHWLDARRLRMFSIDGSSPMGGIEAARTTLNRFVDEMLGAGSAEGTPIGWGIGQNLRRAVPLFTFGDALPRGTACVATTDGRFAYATHDFLADDRPFRAFDEDFEQLVLDALRGDTRRTTRTTCPASQSRARHR
ncbi:MAG: hypothetical protein JWP97_2172 [Labilithrix sp.]|nr:hypothetical protein [Labilithrix sp.]